MDAKSFLELERGRIVHAHFLNSDESRTEDHFAVVYCLSKSEGKDTCVLIGGSSKHKKNATITLPGTDRRNGHPITGLYHETNFFGNWVDAVYPEKIHSSHGMCPMPQMEELFAAAEEEFPDLRDFLV